MIEMQKSTFIPDRPSAPGEPEPNLPFEEEAISLLSQLGVQNWGRVHLATVSVFLRKAHDAGVSKARHSEEAR